MASNLRKCSSNNSTAWTPDERTARTARTGRLHLRIGANDAALQWFACLLACLLRFSSHARQTGLTLAGVELSLAVYGAVCQVLQQYNVLHAAIASALAGQPVRTRTDGRGARAKRVERTTACGFLAVGCACGRQEKEKAPLALFPLPFPSPWLATHRPSVAWVE